MELDGPLRIGVARHQQPLADDAPHRELLEHLAEEAILRRFVRLALAAGKLPRPRQVRAFQTAGQQEAAVALDDGGGDDDRPGDLQYPASTGVLS